MVRYFCTVSLEGSMSYWASVSARALLSAASKSSRVLSASKRMQ